MTVDFTAKAAYGVFTSSEDSFKSMGTSENFVNALWDSLSDSSKDYYGGSMHNLFNDDYFDPDMVDSFMYKRFPLIEREWVGNPYYVGATAGELFIVKSTCQTHIDGKPTSMKDVALVSQEAKKQLRDFCSLANIKYDPQWHLWLKIS